MKSSLVLFFLLLLRFATFQRSTLRDMVFDVPALISAASRVMTLEASDMILTGTPAGVGPLALGDVADGTLRVVRPDGGGGADASPLASLRFECRARSAL